MSTYINFLKLQELFDNGSAVATIEHDALSNETTITINTRTPDNLFIKIRKEKEKMPPIEFSRNPKFGFGYGFSDPLIADVVDKVINKYTSDGKRIKKVIFSNPMTIIIWEDGKKTYARTAEGDEYIPFRGFLLCYAKKNLRKELNQYKDFLFNKDSKNRYFIEHLIKGEYKDWNTYEKQVVEVYVNEYFIKKENRDGSKYSH